MTYKVSSVYKLYINILHTISSATLLYSHNMGVDYGIWHVEQMRTDLIKRVAYAGEKRKGREGREKKGSLRVLEWKEERKTENNSISQNKT